MRICYALAMAGFLAGSPAMAQVVIGGGNDAARHEYRADQERAAGRHDMHEARERAAVGDYRGAAREQAEARQHWGEAREQRERAEHDANRGGVRVEIGH